MARPTATAGTFEEPTREELIKGLWPDKALYASVILFLTGFVGLLTWVVTETIGVSYSNRAPGFLSAWPPLMSLGLSAAAVIAAGAALRRRSTRWAVAGCLFAFLSVGFLGVNALLALVALAFVYRSWQEGETDDPATRVLTADMWPDKALAASLILLIGASVTVFWGVAILFDAVTYAGYFGGRLVFGGLSTLTGLLALEASRRLYLQRSPGYAAIAALAMAGAAALWVVGPVLGLAALVLIVLGSREDEFESPRNAPA